MDKNSKGCLIILAPFVIAAAAIWIVVSTSESDERYKDLEASEDYEPLKVQFKESDYTAEDNNGIQSLYVYRFGIADSSITDSTLMSLLKRKAQSLYRDSNSVTYVYFYNMTAPPQFTGAVSVKAHQRFLSRYEPAAYRFLIRRDNSIKAL